MSQLLYKVADASFHNQGENIYPVLVTRIGANHGATISITLCCPLILPNPEEPCITINVVMLKLNNNTHFQGLLIRAFRVLTIDFCFTYILVFYFILLFNLQ